MCSLSSMQPQFTLSLSHLASVYTAVRSAAQTRPRAQHYGKPTVSHSIPPLATLATDELPGVSEITDCIKDTFSQLGFEHLVRDVTADEINSIILPGITSRQPWHAWQSPDWSISAPTFFENKHGLPRHVVHKAVRDCLRLHPAAVGGMLTSCTEIHQTRGFKTRHSGSAFGVGQKKTTFQDRFPVLKSVFERLFGIPVGGKGFHNPDSIQSLLSDTNASPETRDKLRIAFAEGYAAHSKSEPAGVVWPRRIMKILLYGIIFAFTLQVLRVYTSIGDMKINVLKGDKYEVNPEDITVTFNDVKGADEAKQELKDIVEFLRDPDKFKALGAKLPKGVLLVGPPGIGKSLLARAIAGEAGVPFFHASGSEFDEVFVGTGAKRVRQLFDAAKMRAPCIVFIDEIDTVGAKRTSSQIHPYANQTVNQLLSEMDGFEQNEGIIVLGATNRRDNLDKALLRPGRFDVEVRVFLPDLKGRTDILQHYLGKVKVGTDVDVPRMARGTTGCTGADLENIVNQAALRAAMEGGTAVGMVHMEYARDKVLMGPAKKTKIPDEETNMNTAYHEAGHALVAFYTKDSTPLNKITIIPRGSSLGHTSFVPDKEQYNQTRSQLLAEMDVAMGGRVAEELCLGADKVTTGAAADFQHATGIAVAMVKQLGMSDKVGVRVFTDNDIDTGLSFLKVNDISPATADLVDNEIKRLLQESYERARAILKAHQAEHKALALALMKYETLDLEDLKIIVEGKQLRKPAANFNALQPQLGIAGVTL